MQALHPRRLAALVTAAGSALALAGPTQAAGPDFGAQKLQRSQVIAIAEPYGKNKDKYSLIILEQQSDKRQCWATQGSPDSPPVRVKPLLNEFDFSGICGRATDSNGYSLRRNGTDLGQKYLLEIVRRDGALHLMADPRSADRQPIHIGSTRGLGEGYLKIFLDEQWRFAKRTYQGETLGHFYLAHPQPAPMRSDGTRTASLEGASSAAASSDGAPAEDSDPSDEKVLTWQADADSDEAASTGKGSQEGSKASSASDRQAASQSEASPSSANAESTESSSDGARQVASRSSRLPSPPSSSAKDTGNSDRSLAQLVDNLEDGGAPKREPVPVPDTAIPQGNSGGGSASTAYEVIVMPEGAQQKSQLKSLAPEAFSTTHQGKPAMQAGAFQSKSNAQALLQKLQDQGMKAELVER